MKHLLSLYAIVALAVLSIAIANAQAGSKTTKHYEKDGLAFDYPDGWGMTDTSTTEVQYIAVAQKDGATQIVVIAQRAPGCYDRAEGENVTKAVTERVATQIHATTPLETMPLKVLFGKSQAQGVRLHGVMNTQRVTADIYSLNLKLRLVNLVYLRTDTQENTDRGWTAFQDSFKIATPNISASFVNGVLETPVGSQFVKGRALHLPLPRYPPHAREAGASGSVVVRVTIDERGRVISALPVSGNRVLYGLAVEASKGAEFTPTTLCGVPIRVTSTIVYNFVKQ